MDISWGWIIEQNKNACNPSLRRCLYLVPPRKGLMAKKLVERRPDLTPTEISQLTGAERGHVIRAMRQTRFGRDKPKSRAPGA